VSRDCAFQAISFILGGTFAITAIFR
jgi:hypothetical protein